MDQEPTHHIPRELEDQLVEAKRWYDERHQLEDTIRTYGGIAERNQADRDAFDQQAAPLLEAIVDTINELWGFNK